MFLVLFLLFTALPALEVFLIFKVGQNLGGWNTFGLILLTGFIGASVARTQGRQIWSRVRLEMNQGSLPADQVLQGFMVFLGGLLLVTPGFLTDFLGIAFIFPLTRRILTSWMKRALAAKIRQGSVVIMSNVNRGGEAWQAAASPRPAPRDVTPKSQLPSSSD